MIEVLPEPAPASTSRARRVLKNLQIDRLQESAGKTPSDLPHGHHLQAAVAIPGRVDSDHVSGQIGVDDEGATPCHPRPSVLGEQMIRTSPDMDAEALGGSRCGAILVGLAVAAKGLEIAYLQFVFHRLTLAVCSRIRRDGIVEIEVGLGDPRLPKSAFTADQMRQPEAASRTRLGGARHGRTTRIH